MNKPFNNTVLMMRTLFKRDWLKFIIWLVCVLAYAGSGAGKMNAALAGQAANAAMYKLFTGTAMVSLFGPTAAPESQFTPAAAFGGLMPLLTVIVFAIVTIVYVVNRTRKEEDDGIAELLRSFRIGKLANTTAVVSELFCLQLIISVITGAACYAAKMTVNGGAAASFSSSLLFGATIGAQCFMWGMLALVLANIFSEAGGAKGTSLAVLGALYIVRMGTDIKAPSASWFNPLSWSYLTDVYVKDNWLPIILTVLVALVLLVLAYALEIGRDASAGYLPEGRAKAHAGRLLKNYTGFVLHQQRVAAIGWLAGVLVLGIMYGSMIGSIKSLLSGSGSNYMTMALGISAIHAADLLIKQEFLSTVYVVVSVLSVSFAVTSLIRMVSEERKNRLEHLYSTPLSRLKVYLSYTVLAWVFGALAQFLGVLGIYVAQASTSNALDFATIFKGGMIGVFGTFFILSMLALLVAFAPRAASVIWVYIGFAFMINILGNMLSFPKWTLNANVYHLLTKATSSSVQPNTANVGAILAVTLIAVILTLVGYIGYRHRDLIGG